MTVFKTSIFTILVPGPVTVSVPAWLVPSYPGGRGIDAGSLRFVGVIPIGLGASDFSVAGRGTPAPIEPPMLLIVRGPYRLVGNPMYLGVSLILLGECVVFEAAVMLVYGAIILAGFHLFVVFYEEPVLRRRFGLSYEEYVRTVPRWIPRMRRSGGQE